MYAAYFIYIKTWFSKESRPFAVLKDALPDVLTEEQKSKKLSNLLQKMEKARIIDVKGIVANSEWYLLTKDYFKNNLVKESLVLVKIYRERKT